MPKCYFFSKKTVIFARLRLIPIYVKGPPSVIAKRPLYLQGSNVSGNGGITDIPALMKCS
jgi:hypothetical protein